MGSEGIEERIVPPWIDPCAVEYMVVRCVPNSPPPGSAATLDPVPRRPASDIRRSLHKTGPGRGLPVRHAHAAARARVHVRTHCAWAGRRGTGVGGQGGEFG